MKNKFYFLLSAILLVPAILLAQDTAVPKEAIINPDKLFVFMGIGILLTFVLLIFYVLSRAAAALAKDLGDKYKA